MTHGRVYEQTVPVWFGDADMARILYFPRFFHFCHTVMEGFVAEALGITYDAFLHERHLGLPTVHTEADYHRPMRYGQELVFMLTVRRLGVSSVDFRWRAFAAEEDDVRAEARSTVVCVDMRRFESVPLPPDVRAAFEPYLET